MTYDPKLLAEAIELLEISGFINVEPDPNDPSSMLVSPASKLKRLIDEKGVTMNDFSLRTHPHTT
jgi:hypothetical protein